MICRCSNVGHQHKTKRREERPSRNVCKNTRKRFDRHLRRGGGGGGGGELGLNESYKSCPPGIGVIVSGLQRYDLCKVC